MRGSRLVSLFRLDRWVLQATTVLSIVALGAPNSAFALSDDDMRKALANARDQRWERIDLEAVDDHILSGYIHYHRLRGQLPAVPPERVNAYIDTHRDSPLSKWLRGQTISQYGEAEQWADLRAVAKGEPNGSERQCYYYTALLETNPIRATEGGQALWKVDHSQPSACDTLFNQLRANGDIDATAIWERKMLAWQADETRLKKYLGGLLDDNWQTAKETVSNTDDAAALRQAPACLGPRCAATPSFYRAAMWRLIREDTASALETWREIAPALTLPYDVEHAIEEELAFYVLVRETPDSLTWVDRQLTQLDSERVLELRVRRALGQRQWADALHWIAAMPSEQQASSRWQYWLARANEQLDNHKAAQAHYQNAASDRSFYGFAAAERINQPFSLNSAQYRFDSASRETVAALPAIKRAEALMRIGEKGLANSEWLHAVRNATREQALAIADYADHQQWHALLVQTTIAGGLWDALEWRFPQAYSEQFSHWGRLSGVDPYLLMAIARRESAYNPQALSPAGARGLMQLMPGTAAQVSREIGLSDPGPYGVLDPELNIRLGSTYLRDKLKRYSGNRLAATAAYNAGPSRVDRWLEEQGVEAFDLFVERIPYRETRDYVQAVLAYRVIFSALAKDGDTAPISLLNPAERHVRYDDSLLARH
ncbi:transglycosylase SLT domain-containing protein [Halomonas llamarensis]|uniref:Transglycosylase SLT domain-containing protein n=1 Tax=Halomonas llamarensis TaxID=2945104 RepID=A0ABT0SMB3_9GAMM|nr:transglycosylase SLT domain-containing protein [Halomonas llamarensis]MCL7928931.1 transglycosylase SLT domain-containing protein [Halomonas llamarensis]